MNARVAGTVLPLFSVRSHTDWGIGDLTTMGAFGEVLARADLRLWMLLPLLRPTPGDHSPYSPVSSFAIDPVYIGLDEVEEMDALGGQRAFEGSDREQLESVRGAFEVRHRDVRALKQRWLTRCFERFNAAAGPARRARFERFCAEHASWLDDYALFVALRAAESRGWRQWPEELREAREDAVAEARVAHAETIARLRYEQWLAFEQLAEARTKLRARGIALGGDEPFLVAEDSADVWAHQGRYRFDATVGAPPDAFSETGQDWGLPPYRWDAIAAEDFASFRARGVHAARHFDVVRIDHVVGLYRTYHRPRGSTGHHDCYFVPSDEPSQRVQGEAVLEAFRASGVALIAEDLGVIPDFVRDSLSQLGIPGYRVLRWEERDGLIRPPASWPVASVATNGTHDTEPSALWWEATGERERALIADAVGQHGLSSHYDADVHRVLLNALYDSPSRYAILPIQDLFGLRGRINTPSTVGSHNWSWRLPWTTGALLSEPHLRATLGRLAELSARAKRAS